MILLVVVGLVVVVLIMHMMDACASAQVQQPQRRLSYSRPNDTAAMRHSYTQHPHPHQRQNRNHNFQSLISIPLEHYDFTTACTTNHTSEYDDSDDDVYDMNNNNNGRIVIHPVTSSTSTLSMSSDEIPVLFGPLYSNHPKMFHCQSNKGLFVYTPNDIYGKKNRIENCCSTFSSTSSTSTSCSNSDAPDCVSTTRHTNQTASWDSIVLWIQPNDITYSGRGAILTITRSDGNDNDGKNPHDTTTTIRILQYYSNLIVICETIQTLSNPEMDTTTPTTTTTTTTTTFRVKDYELVSNQWTHIVLTVDAPTPNENENDDTAGYISSDAIHNDGVQIYINGQPMLLQLERHDTTITNNNNNNNIDDDLLLLSSSIPTLQLFSNHYIEDDVFLGSIYQLDIYETILSYDAIISLFELGVGYYVNSNDDREHPHNSTVIVPYYYNDDDENNYWYTAMMDGTASETQRPLMAKLSTTIESSLVQPQVGFVVIYSYQKCNDPNCSLILQNRSTIIQLSSYNQSNQIMQLGIQFTSLPAHGVLRLNRSSGRIISTSIDHTISFRDDESDDRELIIQENDIFLLDGNATSITISYQLPSNIYYFNIPTHDVYGMDLNIAPESLSYRIVEIPMFSNDAVVDDPWSPFTPTPTTTTILNIIKSSDTITMPIYVVHVSDGPPLMILVGPYQSQQYEVNLRNVSTPAMIVLNDYQVMVHDGINVLIPNENGNTKSRNLDYVRVDVLTLSDGTIALNPGLLVLLSDAHEHCTERYYSNWQCTDFRTNVAENHAASAGTSDIASDAGRSSITFLALPNDVPIILNQMIYTSHVAGQGGNVTVRIYSGTGGNECLHAKEHYWNYNLTNPTPDLTAATSTTPDVTIISRATIMDYMLGRNDTCTKVEAILHIPNFTTDRINSNNSHNPKNEFMIFGFVWKEWIFGIIVVSIFLFCFCGGCSSAIVRPLGQLLPTTMRRWRRCCRRSRRQFNYNDYID
jgi:hypothetical protein